MNLEVRENGREIDIIDNINKIDKGKNPTDFSSLATQAAEQEHEKVEATGAECLKTFSHFFILFSQKIYLIIEGKKPKENRRLNKMNLYKYYFQLKHSGRADEAETLALMLAYAESGMDTMENIEQITKELISEGRLPKEN